MSNIQMINFNNQQLLTVEKDGVKYVAIKPICENLGLDRVSQFTKIKSSQSPRPKGRSLESKDNELG